MAAKWISYKDWLKKNRLKPDKANAANWTRQYGPSGVVAPKPSSSPAPSGGDAGGGGGQPQTPAPPAAARRDAVAEQGILNLVNDRNLLPSRYNRQRGTAADNFRGGMLDGGFFDFINKESEERQTDSAGNPLWRPMEFVEGPGTAEQNRMNLQAVQNPDVANRPEGNVTYKLTYGTDGRIYRQAFMSNANTYAARGVSGSLVRDAQRQSRQSIDTARDQSIRNYFNTVNTIGENQRDDDTALTTAITTGNTGYQASSGSQDVTLPTVTTPTGAADASGTNNVVTPNVPTPPVTASGNLGSWRASAVGSNPIARITNRVRSNPRNKGVNFRIVKQGNRYVAVRT